MITRRSLLAKAAGVISFLSFGKITLSKPTERLNSCVNNLSPLDQFCSIIKSIDTNMIVDKNPDSKLIKICLDKDSQIFKDMVSTGIIKDCASDYTKYVVRDLVDPLGAGKIRHVGVPLYPNNSAILLTGTVEGYNYDKIGIDYSTIYYHVHDSVLYATTANQLTEV